MGALGHWGSCPVAMSFIVKLINFLSLKNIYQLTNLKLHKLTQNWFSLKNIGLSLLYMI